MLLVECCTYPRPQFARGTNFYAVASNICGSAVWKLLYITLLAPRFLRWLLDFWKIYGPVFKSLHSSGQHSNTFECIYLTNQCSNTSRAGASFPDVRCVQRTPILIHPQYVFINTSFNCAGEVLSSSCSIMLSHNFGAPALKELAVLDFLCMPRMCYFRRWHSCVGWGETAVVDTGRHAVSSQHSLIGVEDCCRRLENVLPRKLYHVVIISLFLTVYYIILVFR
jgi:hypothetical protein